MARVLLLSADLLFGSQVLGQLTAAGHEVEIVGDGERVRERLRGEGGGGDGRAGGAGAGTAAAGAAPDVLVVDLTDDQLGGSELVSSLRGEPLLPATLGFYSHVDAETRARAESAGFDLVVPRSRMAREGAALVGALAARPA